MKKLLAVLIIVITSMPGLYAQTRQQTKNLTAFAKVWGFLKYYHPSVAKGSPDWDAELLKMVPEIEARPNDDTFNAAVTAWYRSLPEAKLSAAITKLQGDTVIHIFDEQDIKHFGIPDELQQQLTQLYLYHIPDSNKFIGNVYNGHSLDYIYHNENPYTEPSYPDEAHRLLALFRYWNIINYFYPDKHINAKNWDAVLPLFIPKFIADANAGEYRQTFLMLTAQLKDSHSFFSQKDWNKIHQLSPPFTTYYINGKYYIGESRYDSLTWKQDLKVGDEIVSINNKPVKDRIEELKPYTTGTNELSFYRNIGNSLFAVDSSNSIAAGFKRKGVITNKIVPLFTGMELYNYRKTHGLKQWQNMGNGVWYVRICEVSNPDTLKKLFADIQNAKIVIWDMRSYPSFQLVSAMGPGLYQNTPESTIANIGLLLYPGTLVSRNEKAIGTQNELKLPLYKDKMIVLVNEHTQSLSESIAYELRFRPETIIMGRQTAGTTGNILFVDYPGGIGASFTGVGVRGKNNSFSEGKGVKIDKEIKLSGEKLTQYPDYVLETAYQEALKEVQ